jgi:hypothetical protein
LWATENSLSPRIQMLEAILANSEPALNRRR